MATVKLYDSKAWLRSRYLINKKTPEEMAKEANCAPITIYRKLRDAGLMK